MKPKLSVSIVIPNWNGADLLKKHLPAVIKNSNGAHIIVVDDCSTDGSVSYLEERFPQVAVIKKEKHEGFASAVNAGVQAAETDNIVLLNTDIEPEKGYLEPLLSHFSDPSVFAVGCMDKSMESGKIVLRGRGIGWWEKGFYYHRRGEVTKSDTAWVSGGSGAFRRSMWNDLGGMDPLFNPFYWEDIDLSYRARKAGWKLLFEAESVVLHFHEKGTIKREFFSKTVIYISYRNQFLFIWKNCTDRKIMLSHIWYTPIRLVQAFLRGDLTMMKGYISAVMRLPYVLSHRRCKLQKYKRQDTELSMER